MSIRKTVVDGTHIRKSKNDSKPIVGIVASQLYRYSLCQLMPMCQPIQAKVLFINFDLSRGTKSSS